jgi:tetratricopeptide (TPR) repeat protein
LNIDDLHILLHQPAHIAADDAVLLEEVLRDYPYFQAARSLYLKSLYVKNSHLYNGELKKTAIYTTDRDILFDFITSPDFVSYKAFALATDKLSPIAQEEGEKTEVLTLEEQLKDRFARLVHTFPESEEEQEETSVAFQETEPFTPEETEEQEPLVAESIETPIEINSQEEDIIEFTALVLTEITVETIEEVSEEIQLLEDKLELGKPLQFTDSEKYSFQEWLQLAQKKPIDRKEEDIEDKKEDVLTDSDDNSENIRLKKIEIIDKFIETNPKIVPTKKVSSPPINIEISNKENDSLMTETLAKIYLEQKKYQKAIQAYEILILKYPEKSIFFADQILDIKALQQHNS